MLADLRPNTRMLAELAELFGDDRALAEAAGAVSAGELRARRVLAQPDMRLEGPLVDVDEPAVLTDLERRHAALLAEHDMEHLDISQIRSEDRIVTQTIGRSLHADGAAGIAFGSNRDDQPCFALFEGRAALEPLEPPVVVALDDELDILVEVAAAYRLRLVP